jgi:hypothetical protein
VRHCFTYVARDGLRQFCLREAKHFPRDTFGGQFPNARHAMCCECYLAFTDGPCKHARSPAENARGRPDASAN